MQISEKKMTEGQLRELLPGAVVLHNTDEQTREQWVAERQRSIGASDVAAMLGCDPWRTTLQLAVQKRGGPRTEENRAMQRGTRMEPLIRQWVEEDTGCRVFTVPFLLRSPRVEWLTANLDGIGIDADGHPFVVEIKDSSYDLDIYEHIQEHGTPPRGSVGSAGYKYWLQVQSQLSITGCGLACFAVADRADLRLFWWRPNPDVQTYIEDVASSWWPKRVVEGVDPEAVGGDIALLRSLCPPDPEEEPLDLSENHDAVKAMEDYEKAREKRLLIEKDVRALRDEENDARARLEQLMGSAPVARFGSREATRKMVERKGYTVEPSTYVKFFTRKAKTSKRGGK